MCLHHTPSTGDTPTLKAAIEQDLALFYRLLAARRCLHPSAEETPDGWTCRICGQPADSE